MRQRRVTLPQVLTVLRKGRVVEPAHQDVKGNWKCTLECLAAGDHVRVAAAIEEEHAIAVIVLTVMN